MIRILRSYFISQQRTVLRLMTKFRKAVSFPFLPEDFIFNQSDELSKVIFPLIKRVVAMEGPANMDILQSRVNTMLEGFVLDSDVIDSIQSMVREAATSITETTFKRLLTAYDTGDELGETLAEIKDRMSEVFSDVLKNRVNTIARTETMRAANASRIMAYEQSGVVNKVQFYTAIDERTCFRVNTRILTKRGSVRIQKIKKGDYVLTHRDRYRKVIATHRHIYEGSMTSIYIKGITGRKAWNSSTDSNGLRGLTCTSEHPILVNGEWIAAKDIVAGDKITYRAKPCPYCSKLIPIYMNTCSTSCRTKAFNEERWKDPQQHINLSEQNKEYGKAERMRAVFDEMFDNSLAFRLKFGRAVSKGNILWNAIPENKAKVIKRNKKSAQYPTHPFKQQWVRDKGAKALYKTLGRNHNGGSFLEKKVAWWLNNQDIKYEPQKYFNNGKRRFFVDFYLPEYNIIIEADGSYWHNDKETKERDKGLRKVFSGKILHFSQDIIIDDFKRCIFSLSKTVRQQNCFVEVEVSKVETWELGKSSPVYNLTVEEDNSYIASNVVVHNCDTCMSYHNKVYKLSDPNIPVIPIHPNCRCTWLPVVSTKYLKGIMDVYKSLVQKIGTSASGNRGHAGRPGKIGGSRVGNSKLQKEAKDFIAAFAKRRTDDMEQLSAIVDGKRVDIFGDAIGSRVTIPEEIISKMEYSVHNHPGSASFSSGDVHLFLNSPKLIRVDVIGKDGTLYSIEKKRGEKYSRIYKASIEEAQQEWHSVEEKIRPSYQKEYNRDNSLSASLWKEETHNVMKEVASRFEFKYSRKDNVYKAFVARISKGDEIEQSKIGFVLEDTEINNPPYVNNVHLAIVVDRSKQ